MHWPEKAHPIECDIHTAQFEENRHFAENMIYDIPYTKGDLCDKHSLHQWAAQASQPGCGHQLPTDSWMHEDGVE